MDNSIITPHLKNLGIPSRQFNIISSYVHSIALPADKHTLLNAQRTSGKENSLFSKMLSHTMETSKIVLNRAIRRRISKLARKKRQLFPGSIWLIALIIDATLHQRSSRHLDNSQKFNHGKGWTIGHQWTNVALLINDQIIPLPPLVFYTKKSAKKRGIKYRTANEMIAEYIESLDLAGLIGVHIPSEIVVLLDSGYDDKKIQNAILKKGWDFVVSLKNSRTILLDSKNIKWRNISDYFADGRIHGRSIRIETYRNKKRKMRQHFVKQREGSLKGVHRKLKLVCSKRSGDGKIKYLACSRLEIDEKSILLAYARRWSIEVFHREIKSYLGLEHAGVRKFDSLHAHVHWVYCTYNLLKEITNHNVGIRVAQTIYERKVVQKQNNKMIQILTRYKGKEALMSYCRMVNNQIETLVSV